MPRLASDIFVSGLIRQINIAGGTAMIVRKGSPEAGAIFISQWLPEERAYFLFEPALMLDEAMSPIGGRLFRQLDGRFCEAELSERIAREASFDPDYWLLEIEHCSQPVDTMITIIKEV